MKLTSEKQRQSILKLLSNMRQIAKNEMLARGVYLSDEVVNPDLADQGAICGGHQACAVGSMYLAGGQRPKRDDTFLWTLEGVDYDERADFLRHRPVLRGAYDALNEAADRYCVRNNIHLDDWMCLPPRAGTMERLFEAESYGSYKTPIQVEELDKIIQSAQRAVRQTSIA